MVNGYRGIGLNRLPICAFSNLFEILNSIQLFKQKEGKKFCQEILLSIFRLIRWGRKKKLCSTRLKYSQYRGWPRFLIRVKGGTKMVGI